MRVAVTGGRHYSNKTYVYDALDFLSDHKGIDVLIQGGASGADTIAREWAESRQVAFLTFDADWSGLGRSAGPIRNARMISEGSPDILVAFPGGAGTGDMVSKCKRAGIKVWDLR